MKRFRYPSLAILVAIYLSMGNLSADDRVKKTSIRHQDKKEVAVFVTGSLIPRRVRLDHIGTTTEYPLRIIDRREIDQTGRYTTPGAFANEPIVRIIGH